MTRDEWKVAYRRSRIFWRETNKAALDCALYGRGGYLLGGDVPDMVRHVPLDAWVMSGAEQFAEERSLTEKAQT